MADFATGIREHQYYLDKEGRLFFEGAPINDPWTFRLFQRNLEVAPDGRYVVVCDGEYCYIRVEDVPYVVTDIEIAYDSEDAIDGITLLFNGGYRERLDPSTLFVGEGNVLYCKVRKGRFPARFNRSSYYSLTRVVEFNKSEKFHIKVRQKPYRIAIKNQI